MCRSVHAALRPVLIFLFEVGVQFLRLGGWEVGVTVGMVRERKQGKPTSETATHLFMTGAAFGGFLESLSRFPFSVVG